MEERGEGRERRKEEEKKREEKALEGEKKVG